MLTRIIIFSLLFSQQLMAQQAQLTAPAQADIGSKIEVTWQGPGINYDLIYVVKAGATDDAKAIHKVTILNPDKKTLVLTMPDVPGEYELRYYSKKQILARQSITINDVAASLTIPDEAYMGSEIQINWHGPGNDYDQLVLVDSQGENQAHKAILSGKNPVPMKLPEKAGDYQLRYLTTFSKRQLTSKPLKILQAKMNITAPLEADVGTKIEVNWQGQNNNYDRIGVVPLGAEDAAKTLYHVAILGHKNPVQIQLPEKAGHYELRYYTATSKQILARSELKINTIGASIAAPDQADIGSKIEITWQGPGNDYDRIGLIKAGADDGAKTLFHVAILGQKNPLQIQVPEQAGDYELRYYTAISKQILARKPLQVGDVSTSLQAPNSAVMGSQIEVGWQGPGNDYDRIGLVEAGADDTVGTLAHVAILSQKNPVLIKLPEQAGAYELRYYTATSKQVLAKKPLQINAVDTSLQAPETALAETLIAVEWIGPGNDYDYIGLYKNGDGKSLAGASILSQKNPVLLKTPIETGDYELRYTTAREKHLLATRPLKILPTGKLKVYSNLQGQSLVSSAGDAIEIILDASGSMLQKMGNERRIHVAKQVLKNFVTDNLAENSQIAMRVFGHRKPDACDTELTLALGKHAKSALLSHIDGFQAMNLAKTPIADSLAQVPNDLSQVSGLRNVVLITDGEETCEGDPASVIKSLRAQGLNIQVSVVGFAVKDEALKQQFEHWAKLGGGSYFDAQSADDLSRSLKQVVTGPFEVLNAAGEVVTEGIVGGKPMVLAIGQYQVRGKGQTKTHKVNIVAEQTTELKL